MVDDLEISADAYFALTGEGKGRASRDEMGMPLGYWLWSKDDWAKYNKENPRTPNQGARRVHAAAASHPAVASHGEYLPLRNNRKPGVAPLHIVEAAIQAKWPAEFNDGARYGLLNKCHGKREPGGFPPGFHDWPLNRRNAWFAGFDEGYSRRTRR